MDNDKEMFDKGFGLDADEMTIEQKDILREVLSPAKMHWISIVGIGVLFSGVISLVQLDFLWFLIFAFAGVIIFYIPLFIARHKAFKKYKDTVSPDEYIKFREQNRMFYPEYYFHKYGNNAISICALFGLVYIFFNWRIGITIFLFSWNILIPVKYTLTAKMKMKWSWIIFFIVIMVVIWVVYPPL